MRVRGFTSSQVLAMLAAPSTQMSWSYILSNTQFILFKLNQISKLRGTIWIGIELKISENATSKFLRVVGMKGSLGLQTFIHVRPPWPTLTTHLNHMLLKQLKEVARTISIQQISPLEVVVMYFFMKKSILQKKFTSSPHPLARSEDLRHFKG